MLIDLRRSAEARRILEPLIGADPSDGRSLVLLACCAQLDGDPELAIRLCRAAVEAAPDDPDVVVTGAVVAGEVGAAAESYAWAERAVSLAPDSPLAISAVAQAELAHGHRTAALARTHAALEHAPDSHEVRLAYGMALQASRRFADAAEQYVLVLEQDPQNLFALNNLAVLRLTLGDLQRSSRLFGRAVAIDPRLEVVPGNVQAAGAVTRRLAMGRLAVALTLVGVALLMEQTWLVALAAVACAWPISMVVSSPRPIRRRLTARVDKPDVVILSILATGVLLLVAPVDSTAARVVGCVLLGLLGLLLAGSELLIRRSVDRELRRRGVRLP